MLTTYIKRLKLSQFVKQKKFLLSIAYHSSRSGCVSERVIYPWGWTDSDNDSMKVSPDYEVISEIAENLANKIIKEGSSLTYIPKAQKSRTGNAHDWIYTETGCIQFLIEMGSSNIQQNNQQNLFSIVSSFSITSIYPSSQ